MNAILAVAHTARELRGVSARTAEKVEAQRAHARNIRAASEPEAERLGLPPAMAERVAFVRDLRGTR